MQFAIPQFTDIEDKLIGPLTLKQFLALLATGGVALMFWSLFGFGIIFFLFALPTTLTGVMVTFAKFNGRPFFLYVGPLMAYMSQPKTMIYRREGVPVTFMKKVAEMPKSKIQNPKSESSESRLSKLAYLLDQKAHEEEELIEHVTRTP